MFKKTIKIKELLMRKNTDEFLMIFFRQLSEMTMAGIPLYRALEIMGMQFENTVFSKTLEGIKYNIYVKGLPLYRSLSMFPDVFSALCIGTVKAGEEGGFLPQVLRKLAKETEKENNLKKRFYSIMTYPVILIVASIVLILVTLKFILPSFAPLLKSFDVDTPVSTKILNYTVMLFNNPLTIFVLILLVILLNLFIKTKKGSIIFENILLELPIIGSIIRYTAIVRFSRMYALLASTGYPLIDGLQLISESIGCNLYKEALIKAMEEVKDGEFLSKALFNQRVFPSIVISMITVGEESGNMQIPLERLAHLYEVEIETTMERFFTLLEPVLLVSIGLVIGFMMMSVFLPVSKIMTAI
ncbi:MAG: type II secretion system F family protein [Armatimonadota bacterium]